MKFTKPIPGHWSTDEGTEMANRYLEVPRERLALGQQTDLELANAIFMVGRGDLELIGLQTAAKERIRWLSAQLARAEAGWRRAAGEADDLSRRVHPDTTGQ